MQEVSRDIFTHWITVPTRWGEMDALGHINHAMYFRYLEEGRTSWIDQMFAGRAGLWKDEGLILADIQCSYLMQLRHPVTVEVATRISRIGSKSMDVQAAVFPEGEQEPAALSKGVVVWFNYQAQKTAVLPDWLRQAIRHSEKVMPEGA